MRLVSDTEMEAIDGLAESKLRLLIIINETGSAVVEKNYQVSINT